MSKPKKKATETPAEVFKEFTLTLPKHDEPVVVPVVPTVDALPLAMRRRLRNVLTDSGTDQLINHGPKFQLGVDYAIAYAASQGVRVDLEGIEDDRDYDRVRMELLTAGLRLVGHFANLGGDEGKATKEPVGASD